MEETSREQVLIVKKKKKKKKMRLTAPPFQTIKKYSLLTQLSTDFIAVSKVYGMVDLSVSLFLSLSLFFNLTKFDFSPQVVQ